MSEQFTKSKDNQIQQNGLIMNTDEVVDLLNSQSKLISAYNYKFAKMRKENEQLQKQIQNYEQLIANSYVGEEETLDGFVGKYVIWETELQKYKEKIKGVCYEQ